VDGKGRDPSRAGIRYNMQSGEFSISRLQNASKTHKAGSIKLLNK
jgi:hypothetical protein